MQDLPDSIIGTNPCYPKIVDHSWLKPDLATYDNYPSDNNSVRVVPKLAELWGTDEANLHRVPNVSIQQLGTVQATEKTAEVISGIVQEAKKAMMSGLKGKEVAGHLRARFTPQDIVTAREALVKLSDEQGLLGNVYIDASAFNSAKEAEQFLSQHRTRLAQDIIINESKLTPDVIGVLASKYHKNVMGSVNYDSKTLSKYKSHLVASGRIDEDFVVDSKETLREAFLSQRVAAEPAKKEEEKKIDKEVAMKELSTKNASNTKMGEDINEEIFFRKIQPILVTAREQLSKGKSGSAVKEILRKRYASDDLTSSAKYLTLIIANVTSSDLDTIVTAGKTTKYIARHLKEIIEKYPFKKATYTEEKKSERPIGMKAHFHISTAATPNHDANCQASIEALKKGIGFDSIKATLLASMTADEADNVLASAVAGFNASSVGAKANPVAAAPKKKVVEDLPEHETLPDPSKIATENQDILSFFQGDGLVLDIDSAPSSYNSLNIEGLFNRSGIDSGL